MPASQDTVDAGTPGVAVPNLNRPLILGNVKDRARAVLGSYGVSDEVLLETIFGERAPGGKLPFELPSSMAQVRAQFGDVPDDTRSPLYKVGTGGKYQLRATTTPSIKGEARAGRTLTAVGPTWSREPQSVTFRWMRDGHPHRRCD